MYVAATCHLDSHDGVSIHKNVSFTAAGVGYVKYHPERSSRWPKCSSKLDEYDGSVGCGRTVVKTQSSCIRRCTGRGILRLFGTPD